jgi:hypothetical protein
MLRRSHAVLAILSLFAAVATSIALAPAAAAATGTGADFAPDVRPRELHVTRTERGMVTVIHWRSPRRYRMLQWVDLDPVDDRTLLDVRGSVMTLGSGIRTALRHVVITANEAQVTPDGWSHLDGDLMMYAWPLIARERSGEHVLTSTTVNGRVLLRGRTTLAANECAGLRAGVRVVDLDPRTLVPLRIVERRGTRIEFSSTITYRRAREDDFAALEIVGRRVFRNDEFTNQRLSQALQTATWPISIPTSLPAGVALVTLGTAPHGFYLGPEGSFPSSNGVFFARWQLGFEGIDFTSRPARSTLTRDWDESDPFGGECAAASTRTIAVGSVTAHYAVGELGVARLWWRDGTTLYTLSGPFSAEQLAAIASSLAPASAG